MHRTIAASLVALSIVAGAGAGFALQRSLDVPASRADVSDQPRYTVGASTRSGPVTVSDAFLVQSRYGGATLVATVEGPDAVFVHDVTAEIDGRPLPVAIGHDGDVIDSNAITDGVLRLGAAGVDDGSRRRSRPAFVVHDVDVGQEVRVTLDLDGASDAALEVPVVGRDTIDDVALFEGPPPEITDATLAVFDGEEEATLGWTIVSGDGSREESSVDRIVVTDEDGVELNVLVEHQTATGGPAAIVALDEPVTQEAADPAVGGDYDYVDAEAVDVGDPLVLHVPFASGVVDVDVEVVEG